MNKFIVYTSGTSLIDLIKFNEKKIYNDRIQKGIPIAEEAWNLITLRAKSLGVDDLNRFQKAVN